MIVDIEQLKKTKKQQQTNMMMGVLQHIFSIVQYAIKARLFYLHTHMHMLSFITVQLVEWHPSNAIWPIRD